MSVLFFLFPLSWIATKKPELWFFPQFQKNSQFGRTKVEFTCFLGAHLEGFSIVLTRAFQASCWGRRAQGQPPVPPAPSLGQGHQMGLGCSSTSWKGILFLPTGQKLSPHCDAITVRSLLSIKKINSLVPKEMLGGLSVCFPALKGTFLQEKSKRKTLAEPESLGLTLSCQGNSTDYWNAGG